MSLSWRLWINCWKLCVFCQVSMEETIMHFLVVLNEWHCCHRPPPGLPIKRDLQNSVGSCSLCSAKCPLKIRPQLSHPAVTFCCPMKLWVCYILGHLVLDQPEIQKWLDFIHIYILWIVSICMTEETRVIKGHQTKIWECTDHPCTCAVVK